MPTNDLENNDLADLLQATHPAPAATFSNSVMLKVRRQGWRRRTIRWLPGLAFAPWLSDIQALAVDCSTLLMTSLFNTSPGLVTELLAPLNTVAGALAIALLGLRAVYLRLFR